MKDKKNTDLKVFQSNNFTIATHNMNSLQKNVVYRILMYCKDDLAQKRNENLFGPGTIIHFKKADLVHYKADLTRLERDIKNLRERSIIIPKEGGGSIITGIILRASVEPHKDVAIELCNHFINYARHCFKEFTAFQFKVAFNLKGVHTKRIYEICCMVKNLGKYKLLLVRFREILGVQNKYIRQAAFENRILKPVQKRINACADAEVSFDYEFEKKNREVFVVLKIKNKKKQAEIQSKNAFKKAQKKQGTAANDAYFYLQGLINNEIHDVTQIYLDLQAAGKLEEFAEKYKHKQAYNEKEGRNWADLKPIILKILKEDFGIDLKNYNHKLKNKKTKDAPKTHPNPEIQRQINFLNNKNKGNIACVKCETRESENYHNYRGNEYCTGCYEALQNQEEMGGIFNTIMENRKVN